MNYKIVTLDRRHTGYMHFENAIDVMANKRWAGDTSPYMQAIEFQICRNWFWQTYGPSADYDIWLKAQALPAGVDKSLIAVKDWAWETGFGKHRIFISDAAALTHFILANPKT